MHTEGIHHPGHGLGVGVDVGGRDIFAWSDEGGNLGGETTSDLLDLPEREFLGVAGYSTFGPYSQIIAFMFFYV